MSATAAQSGTVNFSISGDFITEHFRDRVREGEWRKAAADLDESFGGELGIGRCYNILAGKAKLIGVNDLEMVDDDTHLDEQWLYDQYYCYFSRLIFFDGKPFTAYGYVDHLSFHDMMIARELRDYGDVDFTELNEYRALTYAKSPSQDRAKHLDGYGWVLFEPANVDYPAWISPRDVETVFANLNGVMSSTLMKYDDKELRQIQDIRNEGPAIAATLSSGLADEVDLDDYLADVREGDDILKSEESLAAHKAKIAALANEKGGWLELHNPDTGVDYRLPRNAFYRWCLANSSAWETIDWTPVSPKGLKMGGDDPNHTDWWLFTGHDLSEGYEGDIESFFASERIRVHRELTGHEFVTLARGDVVSSRQPRWVRHVNTPKEIYMINRNDVIIIPTASPDFEAVAHKCAEMGAILITETGGKLCHLAVVGREFGLTLLMLTDARALIPIGCSVSIDLDKGALDIRDLDAEQAMKLKLSGRMYKGN